MGQLNEDSPFSGPVQTPSTNFPSTANARAIIMENAKTGLITVAAPSELANPSCSQYEDLYSLDDFGNYMCDYNDAVTYNGTSPSSSVHLDDILMSRRLFGEPAFPKSLLTAPPAYITNEQGHHMMPVSGGMRSTVLGGTSYYRLNHTSSGRGVPISAAFNYQTYCEQPALHPREFTSALANTPNENVYLARTMLGGSSDVRPPPIFSHRPDALLAGSNIHSQFQDEGKQMMSDEFLELPTTPFGEQMNRGSRSTSEDLGIPSVPFQESSQEKFILAKQEHMRLPYDISRTCYCKKSKCIQLYCPFFSAQLFCCPACSCKNCYNRSEYEDEINEAKRHIRARKEKEKGSSAKGCGCKSSHCVKNYCDCYKSKKGCTDACTCIECANNFGRRDGKQGSPDLDTSASAAPEKEELQINKLTANEDGDHSDENKSDVEPPSNLPVLTPSPGFKGHDSPPTSDLTQRDYNSDHSTENPQGLRNRSADRDFPSSAFSVE